MAAQQEHDLARGFLTGSGSAFSFLVLGGWSSIGSVVDIYFVLQLELDAPFLRGEPWCLCEHVVLPLGVAKIRIRRGRGDDAGPRHPRTGPP